MLSMLLPLLGGWTVTLFMLTLSNSSVIVLNFICFWSLLWFDAFFIFCDMVLSSLVVVTG